jgi:hypothetical protein
MSNPEQWMELQPKLPTRGKTRGRTPAKLDNQYADALEDMEAAESKMRRAFHAYEKAQARVKRLGKLLDKLQEI